MKRAGGRWQASRQCWQFGSLAPLEQLAGALPANGGGRGARPAGCAGDLRERPARVREAAQAAQNAGHRNRLRQRFLEAGPAALPDYELLELLLFFSIDVRHQAAGQGAARALRQPGRGAQGRSDAARRVHRPQAREPRDRRLSRLAASELYQHDRAALPGEVSEAGRRWQAFEQDKDGAWEIVRLWRRRETQILLRAVGELLQRVLREEIRERPVIGSWTALIDYLQVALAHEPIEQFRVLFLDRKNILIRDEVQQRGTVDHAPLYPREITRRALELQASSIILVHNHPSGDPTPSRADIEMTSGGPGAGAGRHRGPRPRHRRQEPPHQLQEPASDLR